MARKRSNNKWDESKVSRDESGRFIAQGTNNLFDPRQPSQAFPQALFDPLTMQPTRAKPAPVRQRAQQGGSMFIQVGSNARKRFY